MKMLILLHDFNSVGVKRIPWPRQIPPLSPGYAALADTIVAVL